jgi:thioredoxin reductase (NADPH)
VLGVFGFFCRNRNVAVIGGGNTAIEETLYLSNIVNKVYLIHRGSTFSAEKILVQRLKKKIQNKKIIIYFNCNVKEIFGDSSGITEILVMQTNPKILTTFKIKISGLFIAIGHVPNTDIFLNQIETQNGYIKTMHKEHGNFTQTSIPGIFAAGDVIDHVYKQAITSSASGCMAALDAEKYLANLL